MKRIYSLEPGLCFTYPEALINFSADLILPKYFYTQLIYLSQGNFQLATDAATMIINSLIKQEESDILIFKNISCGIVYFVDETTNQEKITHQYQNIDTTNLLDRYLLSLLKLSEILEAEIMFLASSGEVIRKCHSLNFEVVTIEEFSISGESWLTPEMLVDIQATYSETTSELEPLSTQEQATISELNISLEKIQWQDIRVAEQESNIQWFDINLNRRTLSN